MLSPLQQTGFIGRINQYNEGWGGGSGVGSFAPLGGTGRIPYGVLGIFPPWITIRSVRCRHY